LQAARARQEADALEAVRHDVSNVGTTPLGVKPARGPSPDATVGFDNGSGVANLRLVMPFDATLNRGLLRAGNLIAGN
jgi:hypothetical protein